ncbi:hypothetical protein ACFL0K_00975 [Patescibacteria group bacterium]
MKTLKHENKIIKVLYATVLSMVLFMPIIVFAAEKKLVPCGGSGQPDCDFNMLVQLAQNIIEFIIMASPFVAAVAFAYAGWMYITAAGDTGQIKKAHGIFTSVFIGLVIILAAWLIVKAILVGLGAEDWAIRLGR